MLLPLSSYIHPRTQPQCVVNGILCGIGTCECYMCLPVRCVSSVCVCVCAILLAVAKQAGTGGTCCTLGRWQPPLHDFRVWRASDTPKPKPKTKTKKLMRSPTCFDHRRWKRLVGRPGEDHLPGIQQKAAVPRNQAGKVGGFRPLHQQHQRLWKRWFKT